MGVGTLAGWATFTTLIILSWIVYRGGGGEALRTLQTANGVLHDKLQTQATQIHEQQGRIDEQEKLIAELRARTDIAAQLEPITRWTVEHEHRDQQRFERTLTVLELIGKRLGPEEGFSKMADVLERIAEHFDPHPEALGD